MASIDLGGQIRRFGEQASIKYRIAIESLAEIGYQAIALGPQELRLSAEQLITVGVNVVAKPDDPPLFVAANVGLLDPPGVSPFVASYRVLEVGGRKIGVTAVLGEGYQNQVNNADIKMTPPAEALEKIAPELKQAADFCVLLSHAPPAETRALAARFPQFDVVVTAGGADEPPNEAEVLEGGKTRLVEVGHKGMYVAVLGLYDDPQTPLRYQRVPLDARFENSPAMHQKLVEYQKKLEAVGLDKLILSPAASPTDSTFVGSEKCIECHTRAGEKWRSTPHSHATETLVALDPPRHFDPECLSCHSTGWDAQKYVPYVGGFAGLEKTPLLTANGCENCHGPGSRHVAAQVAEQEGDAVVANDQLRALQRELRLTLADAEQKCIQCHDHDNSPAFEFTTYMAKIEHHGKE